MDAGLAVGEGEVTAALVEAVGRGRRGGVGGSEVGEGGERRGGRDGGEDGVYVELVGRAWCVFELRTTGVDEGCWVVGEGRWWKGGEEEEEK